MKRMLLAVCLVASTVFVVGGQVVAVGQDNQRSSVTAQSILARDQFKESFVGRT